MTVNDKVIFLYMNFFVDDDSIGITKKIKAQIRTLRKMGLKVIYTAYVSDGAVIIDNEDNVIFKKRYLFKNDIYRRYYRRFLLIKTAIEYLKNANDKIDLAYLRWHTFDKTYLAMLKELKRHEAKIVVEAHAWTPDRKVVSLISKYQIEMDKRYSVCAKDYVDLVAGMSEFDNIWGIRTVKIDNAVDLESVKPRNWKKNDDVFRIVSVSNERNYHGYDRLLKGLKNYYDNGGNVKIEVHFVGVFMEQTKRLSKDLGLENSIYFHGKMFGDELDELYDNSDFGIGALAHHRVGMFSGSSLKTKEYFAKGLPFIYGWKEPAFDETYPYAMKVKLCEEPIDVQALIDFYDGIKNDAMMLQNMRDFAQDNYSWENEFLKVFKELEEQDENKTHRCL